MNKPLEEFEIEMEASFSRFDEWPPEDLDDEWIREQIRISEELKAKKS